MTVYDVKSVVLINALDEGVPGPEHFNITDSKLNEEDLPENGILVKTLVMSADPYLRGTIRSTGYNHAGKVMSGFIVGTIIGSKNSDWVVGDIIGGGLFFSTYQIVTEPHLKATTTWKLTGLLNADNISLGVGILGMPGATAYGGLIDVLRPKRGETIFISAASGAVGGLVGMLAKQLFNCKVIGSCGGPAKCALVKDKYGFDAAIDYKTVANAEELLAQLKAVAPEGIDMYFENVGGMHFDAAMEALRPHGRVAVCGQISEYNAKEPAKSSFNVMKMIYTSQRVEGFLSTTWLNGSRGNFIRDMSEWLGEGKIAVQETVFEGIEQWPMAFQALFTGANVGKVAVKISEL